MNKSTIAVSIKSRTGLILIILLLIIISAGYAENNPKKKIRHWGVEISLSPYYDSNILKYSDKYIDRFMNREDEGRFHINRYDDMVVQYSGRVTYTNEFIKKLKSIFFVDYRYNRYSFNTVKDWTRFNIAWRQYFLSRSSFMVSYSYIPHYYVRHFRDEDWIAVYGYTPITFKPYEFSKDDFSFWIHHYILSETALRLYFSYYKYFLDQNNTEYDSDDYLFGFRIFQKVTNKLRVDAGYKYIYSKARGYDEPGETRETSDDVDATNYSHNYFGGISYTLPKVFGLRNRLNVDINYERVFYTTDHFYEVDPIHAGRHDKVLDMSFSYDINLPFAADVSVFYSFTSRKTGTPAAANAEYISDEKSYNQYQTGIKIKYSFEF
jgi:hypothetical protein